MAILENMLPYILLTTTLVIELIAFLSSHMIDSRNIPTLHEGIFQRCVYASKEDPTQFNCLWWSADTFNADNGSLKCITVLVFFSLILLGLTLMYGILSYYYEELRAYRYNQIMASSNAVNGK